MIRVGLIARADNSGLGVQTWEFFRHVKPLRTLVIDVGDQANTTSHCNKATYLDRYPGATVFKGWRPDMLTLSKFLTGLDVVFTCETPYHPALFDMARELGVRTVLQPNVELLDNLSNPHAGRPDLFAAPSAWRYDELPDPKTRLPVPVALDRFTPRPPLTDGARRHFVHIVGRPAVNDRNGTADLMRALRHVTADVAVTIRTQDWSMQLAELPRDNVEVKFVRGDVQNYWDNYTDGDVLLMPRRYGGLCLPAQEAVAAGMPVIMTDISPNNSWLPAEWLVPATHAGSFRAKVDVDYFSADPHALAAKIDQFTDPAFMAAQRIQAGHIANALSWDTLWPLYCDVLAG